MEQWKNRIVGYGDVAVDQVMANENNWRVHPAEQQAAMRDIFDEVGVVQNIIINRRLGEEWPDGERGVETLVDGHMRVVLAMRGGQKTLPVTYVNLSPEDERLVLATLDPISALSSRDDAKVAELLGDIETQSAAVRSLLQSLSSEAAPAAEADKPELTISPELFERQDYLVFYFDNEFDWQVAVEKLGITPAMTGTVKGKTIKHVGLGRVLPASVLLGLLDG